MSEEMNPDVIASDVPETVETVETVMTEENVESAVNWSEKTLAELVHAFEELVRNEERMKMSKDAEAIKAAFYKRLIKEKAEAGLALAEVQEEMPESEGEDAASNPFTELEKGFKPVTTLVIGYPDVKYERIPPRNKAKVNYI